MEPFCIVASMTGQPTLLYCWTSEASQQLARSVDDVQIPPGLAPHLHDHFRQMHRISADSHYKGLAESAVNSIASNIDRAEQVPPSTQLGRLIRRLPDLGRKQRINSCCGKLATLQSL